MKGLDLQQTDVVIIGAGPSGSSAAALLRTQRLSSGDH